MYQDRDKSGKDGKRKGNMWEFGGSGKAVTQSGDKGGIKVLKKIRKEEKVNHQRNNSRRGRKRKDRKKGIGEP